MPYWWQIESMLGHLQEILAHINYTRTSPIYKKTELCRYLFDALNKTWTAFNDFQGKLKRADILSFRQLLIEGIPNKYIEEFIKSKELQDLVNFEPPIMNHNTLRRRGYRPDKEIGHHLVREATDEHLQLVNAYRSYKENPSDDTKERLLKKTAQLLYVVRSNIAHGEKTPYGPDLKKTERDEKVSGVVIPVLLKLLELIFDKPDQKLVVYGTLAPNAPNERLLKNIAGTWQDCKIRGRIIQRHGLKYFKWIPDADEINTKMFVSESLSDKLSSIDQFEGEDYHRILIPAKVGKDLVVANIYEWKYDI
ncbi:gamma-glutamylcyclotransferase [Thermodesulforhabdus norvegica]|uniref:Uncharacterized conserved protein YtfP, gamma-glutamylcyclotransferase (GGCT)/AIG2-like family n=1 Tax=Thermodesulforhabdus norvegica TaxID=39841 RepID=A0A1I4VVQ0_9BACT|nr:gamma-glutamylcyclotransferase [Thermodesulforhabdus norvegica]SFN05314.1 Uncharacterized conserved protein YtfP, gamma-glutamylcyclotransferase (GGCT)/AIG2-like family [Thermodesulforhabdus norvegica]